jgi:hypothetical protein
MIKLRRFAWSLLVIAVLAVLWLITIAALGWIEDACAQTRYVFPSSTQAVTFGWKHDQAGKGTVWYRLYYLNGSVSEIPDTTYTIQHSYLGDSTVVYFTAYWRITGEESGPSNLSKILFKAVVPPPPTSNYLTLPYVAGRTVLHDKGVWKIAGATVSRIGGYIMYGPRSSAGANPGSMWMDFSLRDSGKYRVSVWAFGDTLSVNGKKLGFNNRNVTKQELAASFPVGINRLTLKPAFFSIEVDSVRLERVESIAPPNAVFGVTVRAAK